ncbi:MAG: S9 family peptidase [Treponemataceae bacterium]
MKQSNFEKPPIAKIQKTILKKFNTERVDNYFWLKDKNNKDVIEYLNQENKYTASVMDSTKELQSKIYSEIVGRIKEDDISYPIFENGYYYYFKTEKGKEYRTYCRKKDLSENAKEEILFDVNKMADGKSAFIFDEYYISPDNKKSAYTYNETGSYAEFTLKIRNLETGNDFDLKIEGVASFAWGADSESFVYSKIDKTLRSCKIYAHSLTENNEKLLYEEKDTRFYSYVYLTRTRDLILLHSSSTTTSEAYLIDTKNIFAEPVLFMPRVQGVEYQVFPHAEKFFILYKNEENKNGKIYSAPREKNFKTFSDLSQWTIVREHDANTKISDNGGGLVVQKDYLVVELRENGLIQIESLNLKDKTTKRLNFPEPVYNAMLFEDTEYEETTIRYSYSSLNRPSTLYEVELNSNKISMLKQTEIPSGFNSDDYIVERLWAEAKDGVKVPMAIVYKKGLKRDGKNPTLLYSYGSYGHSTDAYFRNSVYSLIDRGFIYAIAQIRGGSELGEAWYEDGKFLKKKNTFTDFIACAEDLISKKYTSPEHLAIQGGSAGGLLMGAVINMRPEIFACVISEVPFVDVVTTMLDDTLPLTTGEYEEWGNPNEEVYFNYMLSYSPYDNVKSQNYPAILVTGGLNDSQVLFHEPAKYTAKLRSLKTDDNILLLKMNMDSGHGGATGRYEYIKDIAFTYAFILKIVGE